MPALSQTPRPAEEPFEPFIGQPGRDVVWEPSPEITVEKMLDIARLTPNDYVIDLGSGDGRMIIAAARRGVRGHGVEFNPKMVALSNRRAQQAGVSELARFVEGDMYTADISQASVLPLFLLTENLNKLTPSFLKLKPGTRIVLNAFLIDGWEPDESADVEGDCGRWCNIYLVYVPAPVEGQWRMGEGTLALKQKFQMLTGTFNGQEISAGRMRGAQITFKIGETTYIGQADGGRIAGVTQGGSAKWTAQKM
ncbi:MAG: methyltransferase domain-containing protein [Alphaproteobacteria bacterium]|nr:methyltransferase domain-containing protein [Alphaproteobacteria bacterium]